MGISPKLSEMPIMECVITDQISGFARSPRSCVKLLTVCLGLSLFLWFVFSYSYSSIQIEAGNDFNWVSDSKNQHINLYHSKEIDGAQKGNFKNYLKNYKNPCWLSGPPARATLKCIPYFYVVGFGKSGSTSLWNCLNMHPDIAAATKKEIAFWETKAEAQVEQEYTPFFEESARKIAESTVRYQDDNGTNVDYHQKITFDGTPRYLWHGKHLPTKLHHVFPGTKIIIIMRHPTDRLHSHYHHEVLRSRREFSPQKFHNHVSRVVEETQLCLKTKPISNCSACCPNLGYSMYHKHIKIWMDVIPQNHMFFIKAEELHVNTSKVLKDLFQFLDLAPASPDLLQEMTIKMQITLPPGIIEYAAKYLPEIKFGTDKYWSTLKEHFQNHSIWHEYKNNLYPETRTLLDDFYQPYNEQLAELLNDDKYLFRRYSEQH